MWRTALQSPLMKRSSPMSSNWVSPKHQIWFVPYSVISAHWDLHLTGRFAVQSVECFTELSSQAVQKGLFLHMYVKKCHPCRSREKKNLMTMSAKKGDSADREADCYCDISVPGIAYKHFCVHQRFFPHWLSKLVQSGEPMFCGSCWGLNLRF